MRMTQNSAIEALQLQLSTMTMNWSWIVIQCWTFPTGESLKHSHLQFERLFVSLNLVTKLTQLNCYLLLLTSSDAVESEEPFCKLRDWIENFLQYSSTRENSALDTYMNDCEFWEIFPEIVWALSRRR